MHYKENLVLLKSYIPSKGCGALSPKWGIYSHPLQGSGNIQGEGAEADIGREECCGKLSPRHGTLLHL